jgi:hypothetical protein
MWIYTENQYEYIPTCREGYVVFKIIRWRVEPPLYPLLGEGGELYGVSEKLWTNITCRKIDEALISSKKEGRSMVYEMVSKKPENLLAGNTTIDCL